MGFWDWKHHHIIKPESTFFKIHCSTLQHSQDIGHESFISSPIPLALMTCIIDIFVPEQLQRNFQRRKGIKNISGKHPIFVSVLQVHGETFFYRLSIFNSHTEKKRNTTFPTVTGGLNAARLLKYFYCLLYEVRLTLSLAFPLLLIRANKGTQQNRAGSGLFLLRVKRHFGSRKKELTVVNMNAVSWRRLHCA